jgi:tRNA1Val (adenine37-N6)-methyltransferase
MLTLDTILDLRLYQHKSGYRFSADAVLLSSFVNIQRLKTIADLGAGSGIIGLLLAKKYPAAEIMMIEMQEGLARLADKNAVLNGLDDRVRVVQADIRKIFGEKKSRSPEEKQRARSEGRKIGSEARTEERLSGQQMLHSFDLIVSNPPFRKPKSGLISPSDERAMARHEIHLPIAALMKASFSMLKHHGRLCIIHLPERLAEVIDAMHQHQLEPKRLRFVHSNIQSEAKMVLIEAVKEGRPGVMVERPLYMYDEAGEYTAEMMGIYGK